LRNGLDIEGKEKHIPFPITPLTESTAAAVFGNFLQKNRPIDKKTVKEKKKK
jgi:hypothetical protein